MIKELIHTNHIILNMFAPRTNVKYIKQELHKRGIK